LHGQFDAARAQPLAINQASEGCYQGQTHGHAGFLLSGNEAHDLLRASPACRDVVFPYLTGDELLDRLSVTPWRWIIDFQPRDLPEARTYPAALARVEVAVLPARKKAAAAEATRNKAGSPQPSHPGRDGNGLMATRLNWHHRRFLEKWWLLSYPRPELIAKLRTLPRYIACSRVTTFPVFAFVSSAIHPSDVVQVFPFADDYSFGILQSSLHWDWFRANCSTLGNGPRYTSETVFNTFPWPQQPSLQNVRRVAKAGVALRACRRKLMSDHGWNLRQLYRAGYQDPGHPLSKAQLAMDRAVRAAYRMPTQANPLAFLLRLNNEVAELQKVRRAVTGPGLPEAAAIPAEFTSIDCLPAPRHMITIDAGNCSQQRF
jgi:hypothetical protein